ncbi:MAG: hypothetical protein AAF802_09780 [Planctomycetota bacterium]
MPLQFNWIERGFQIVRRPGISRAWIRVEPDGRQLILTDTHGFDLPNREGPFQICVISHDDELIEGPIELSTPLALARWLRERSTIAIPADPRM